MILRNLKDVSWAGAKAMMADTGFLKGLVEFDKDSLSDKQVSPVLSGGCFKCFHMSSMACLKHSLANTVSQKCLSAFATGSRLLRSQSWHAQKSLQAQEVLMVKQACTSVCVGIAGKESAGVHEGSKVYCR